MLGLDYDAHILELRERFFDRLLEPLRTEDARIQFVHAEAGAFLLNTSAPAYTVIVNDCYVKVHLLPALTTRSRSRRCLSALFSVVGRRSGQFPPASATVVTSSAL